MTNPTEARLLQPGGLASELRRLRDEADLTGAALAERLGEGWTQPRISKLENGRQLPSSDDIRAIGTALNLDQAVVERLLDLREQVSVITRSWRRGRNAGQAAIQRSYDERVRAAHRIRNHENNVIPGLLQTADYARHQAIQGLTTAGFDPAELDVTVAARIERQQVLDDASKQFEFSIDEAALRMAYCPADVMLGQLGRLLEATRGPSHIWFGIVPFGVNIPFVPQIRFMQIDDEVSVEHFAGDVTLTGDEARTFSDAMDRIKDEAVTGEAARKLIVDAMRWLSSL
ncbi:helix-turn-helix domain-containing protein [Dactylosporangium roseum]|uniref:Helix-turn-helix domain-containing protein n=1 Tax=Dactylosporangium roseum TaxID=47989 RepID=A0ABY5Z9Z1_9ACTN|nr:helix-turn-helix transcriptional regulator [Dactylosporangium roseum]UWZ37813.1 helix-turn-helix domain-containing protein [Dactylosporangium roseum]